MQMHIQVSPQLKQVLTTEMVAQLEILQMNNEELAQLIVTKALENPLIELEEINYSRLPVSTHAKSLYIENMAVVQQKDTVIEQLMEQISLDKQLSYWQQNVLQYLILNLDERLFLTISIEDVAKKFVTSPESIESCIDILQAIGPNGIATKNSRDFLLKQVQCDATAPPYAEQFIINEMNTVAKLEIPYLMKAYKLTKEQVLNTVAYIKCLKPYPYHAVSENVQTIIPDLEIVWQNHYWKINMYSSQLPNITINDTYVTLLSTEKGCKSYLEQHLKDANFLIDSINQRQKTLVKIVHCILDMQPEFATGGIHSLRPLRLIDVAMELQLHESTVSRAIRYKHVQSPFGVLALKDFFPKGLQHEKSTKMSNIEVKERIRQLIAEESSSNPLSDQQLAEALMNEGIRISRRTVAKYRESLSIPNSVKRMYIH